MFNPTKPWRRWCRKTNLNIRRYAMASAIAASALPSLLMARGHRISDVQEVPLVVDDRAEGLTKTKDASTLLKKLGAGKDAEKAAKSRHIRPGKGKYRNRRFVTKKGPLVIYGTDSGLQRALKNLPGVECRSVRSMKLRELAPGGQVGRFIIWTRSAFMELDNIFGTFDALSKQKTGYSLPLPCVAIADMGRVIMSEEVQHAVRAPRGPRLDDKTSGFKPNPLTNKAAMLELNPHFGEGRKILPRQKVIKRMELISDRKLRKYKKAFKAKARQDSDYAGEDYEQFSSWLGMTH